MSSLHIISQIRLRRKFFLLPPQEYVYHIFEMMLGEKLFWTPSFETIVAFPRKLRAFLKSLWHILGIFLDKNAISFLQFTKGSSNYGRYALCRNGDHKKEYFSSWLRETIATIRLDLPFYVFSAYASHNFCPWRMCL